MAVETADVIDDLELSYTLPDYPGIWIEPKPNTNGAAQIREAEALQRGKLRQSAGGVAIVGGRAAFNPLEDVDTLRTSLDAMAEHGVLKSGMAVGLGRFALGPGIQTDPDGLFTALLTMGKILRFEHGAKHLVFDPNPIKLPSTELADDHIKKGTSGSINSLIMNTQAEALRANMMPDDKSDFLVIGAVPVHFWSQHITPDKSFGSGSVDLLDDVNQENDQALWTPIHRA